MPRKSCRKANHESLLEFLCYQGYNAARNWQRDRDDDDHNNDDYRNNFDDDDDFNTKILMIMIAIIAMPLILMNIYQDILARYMYTKEECCF